MNTYWVTFYSYKGGVGRSMALANVAAQLAKDGRRVLLIDFDLEAPGLDSFDEFGIKPGSPGVVEYVSKYLETEVAPPIGTFVQEVIPAKQPLQGRLWVMPSGAKDAAYNSLRMSINWDALYEKHQGAAFIENWKADIEQRYRPDFVFIDSRTGLTDVGGICTLHFPDLVVLLFALNEQNIQGIASVARVLRDAQNAPRLLSVATPVPSIATESRELVEKRLARAESVLGIRVEKEIHYHWPVSLGEKVFTWEKVPSLIAKDYEELSRAIVESNPSGLDALMRQAKELAIQFDQDRADEICKVLEKEFGDRADAWFAIAETRLALRDPESGQRALETALSINPNHLQAFERIDALLRVKRRHDQLLQLVTRLADEGRIKDPGRLWKLRNIQGEMFMRGGLYLEAERAYGLANRSIQSNKQQHLAVKFNLAEASRRASGIASKHRWQEVIDSYEDMAAGFSSDPPASRANRTQAMHIPYAICGHTKTALEMLTEAGDLLRNVSATEKLFCVAVYDSVSVEEFREWNTKMIEAVRDQKELWDGMQLPLFVAPQNESGSR